MTIQRGSPVRPAPFGWRPLRHALLMVAGLVTCGCAAHRHAGPAPTASHSAVFIAPFHEGDKRTYRFALLTVQSQGVKVGKPVNIATHPGNDRHPTFLPDSSGLAFWSSRASGPVPYRYDIATRKIVAALDTATGGLASAPNNDGVGVTPAGSKVMGRKSRLLIWQPGEDRWINIADARRARVTDITEVAVSHDGKWIAFAATVTRK